MIDGVPPTFAPTDAVIELNKEKNRNFSSAVGATRIHSPPKPDDSFDVIGTASRRTRALEISAKNLHTISVSYLHIRPVIRIVYCTSIYSKYRIQRVSGICSRTRRVTGMCASNSMVYASSSSNGSRLNCLTAMSALSLSNQSTTSE